MTGTRWQRLGGDTRGTVTALSPAGPDDVFAITPVGVFRSRDAGRTWDRAGNASSIAFGEAVAISGSGLFVGGADGLHHSRDGGQTWKPALTDSRVCCIAAHAASEVLVVGTETDGILRSEDDGRSWSSGNAGLLDLTVLALALSPEFDADGLGFAGTTSGVYRTRNAARSWRAVEAGLGDAAIQCLAVSPVGAIVAGTENDGLVCSFDGGTRWQRAPELDGLSVTAVACSRRGALAAATDAGIATSTDAARSWMLQAADMAAVLALLFVEDDDGREVLLAGCDGNGAWRSLDGGRTWTSANTGLHASLLSNLVVASETSLMVAGPNAGVRASDDAGQTWHEHAAGLGDAVVLGLASGAHGGISAATSAGVFTCAGEQRDWQAAIAGAARLVACAERRTVAACDSGELLAAEGQQWRALTSPFSASEVLALALSPPRDIFAATGSSSETVLWRSADDGASWQRWLVEPCRGATVSIAVSPNYRVDERVFVGLEGSLLTPRRGTREVRNGEHRPLWRRSTLPEPAARITAVAVSPEFPADHRLYVATSAGVFRSIDAGQTFEAWNDGLDARPMLAVAVAPERRVVFALELGGQVWRRADG